MRVLSPSSLCSHAAKPSYSVFDSMFHLLRDHAGFLSWPSPQYLSYCLKFIRGSHLYSLNTWRREWKNVCLSYFNNWILQWGYSPGFNLKEYLAEAEPVLWAEETLAFSFWHPLHFPYPGGPLGLQPLESPVPICLTLWSDVVHKLSIMCWSMAPGLSC